MSIRLNPFKRLKVMMRTGHFAGHDRAVSDIRRAVVHHLPCALYLRNFTHANAIHQLSEALVCEEEGTLMIIDPQVSYSLVDHKLLELFPECIVSVVDPAIPLSQLESLIPMLMILRIPDHPEH